MMKDEKKKKNYVWLKDFFSVVVIKETQFLDIFYATKINFCFSLLLSFCNKNKQKSCESFDEFMNLEIS